MNKFQTTLILVTHDQNEAMTFTEIIIVKDSGQTVQSGTSKKLFERPRILFVAYLLGTHAMNMYQCSIENNELVLGSYKLKKSIPI